MSAPGRQRPESAALGQRPETPNPAPDQCPRCGSRFACGAAGPGPCACTAITLSEALQVRLRGQYSGCLCLACLKALADADTAAHGAG